MKNKLFLSMMVLVMLLTMAGPSSGQAAYAYQLSLTTYITYQNIGPAATQSVYIYLYKNKDDTTPLPILRPNLAKDASTSVGVGELTSGSFNGTAILSSDQPMAATLVQLPPDPAFEPRARNRPISNGFASGTGKVYLPTVLKKYSSVQQITKFGIQNTGSTPTTVTFKIYGSSPAIVATLSETIQPGAGWSVDANNIPALGNGFIGSGVLETTGGGSIVASILESDYADYYNKAYEGVGEGANIVFMPSALCSYRAAVGVIQTSYYGIQNTSPSTNASVTVDWGNGNQVFIPSLAPYTKAVVGGCDGGNSPNFIGSAKITSTQPIIVLGKVNGGGLSTGFIGFNSNSGHNKISLPYVRWAANPRWFAGTMQRTSIAIQNVGASPINGIITVKYINSDGSLAGTHPIDTSTLPGGNLPVGGKVNSWPTSAGLTEFGCYANCTKFGGGAVIEGDVGVKLAAIARLESYVPATGTRVGEDYNGIPYP